MALINQVLRTKFMNLIRKCLRLVSFLKTYYNVKTAEKNIYLILQVQLLLILLMLLEIRLETFVIQSIYIYILKIAEIETRYFTTSDYNKFTGEILDLKIKKELVYKYDISRFRCDIFGFKWIYISKHHSHKSRIEK